MGREATMYLLEKGVRVTGTDAWSWDAPFALTAQKWMEIKDPSIIWEHNCFLFSSIWNSHAMQRRGK